MGCDAFVYKSPPSPWTMLSANNTKHALHALHDEELPARSSSCDSLSSSKMFCAPNSLTERGRYHQQGALSAHFMLDAGPLAPYQEQRAHVKSWRLAVR
eukprot:scaffold251918_cov37-Tisochrysis_lutea.AAC.3